jgi:ubiquinone/menaquinone biosynthesis C-methylase UbiE
MLSSSPLIPEVKIMHERRYKAEIERLRAPQRMALLEVERVIDICLDGIRAGSMLDVGTGSGIFAEAFARKGLTVAGIDPNPEMLKAAKEFIPKGEFRQGIIEKMPFKDKSFDLVFLGHVLHESDDQIKALIESKRCAKQRIAILEWPYKEEEIGPPLNHRLKPKDVVAAAEKVGFSNIETIQLAHMILFRLDNQTKNIRTRE